MSYVSIKRVDCIRILYNTLEPIYTDTWYKDNTCYNDNLHVGIKCLDETNTVKFL